MRKCSRCKTQKDDSEFSGSDFYCRECRRSVNSNRGERAYRQKKDTSAQEQAVFEYLDRKWREEFMTPSDSDIMLECDIGSVPTLKNIYVNLYNSGDIVIIGKRPVPRWVMERLTR